MACYGARGAGRKGARISQGLGFTMAQVDLVVGEPLADCGIFGSLLTPAISLGVASPRWSLGSLSWSCS